jgi:hypothetical protein
MHESFPNYFRLDLYPEIRAWLNLILPGFSARTSGSPTKRLNLDFDLQPFGKEADEGLFIWSKEVGHYGYFPGMIIEVGCSETWNELKNDARDWLWGSKGEVKCVVLVKLIAPSSDFGDETKWRGFLEIHIRAENSK